MSAVEQPFGGACPAYASATWPGLSLAALQEPRAGRKVSFAALRRNGRGEVKADAYGLPPRVMHMLLCRKQSAQRATNCATNAQPRSRNCLYINILCETIQQASPSYGAPKCNKLN